jgi:hypothetical protein
MNAFDRLTLGIGLQMPEGWDGGPIVIRAVIAERAEHRRNIVKEAVAVLGPKPPLQRPRDVTPLSTIPH